MAKSGCGEEDIQENDIPFVSKKTFFGSDKETCRPEESDVGAFGNTSTNKECAFIGRYRRSKDAERSYTDFSCLVVLTLFSPGFFWDCSCLGGASEALLNNFKTSQYCYGHQIFYRDVAL